MQARTFFPVSIALAVLLAGCTHATAPAAPDTRDADAQAIRQVEADGLQAITTKDAVKTTSIYADDASVLMQGLPVITGKANIANYFKQAMTNNFSVTNSLDKVVVSKSGDLAFTQSSSTFNYTDPKTKKAMLSKGKFVHVYMKQADGSWKLEASMLNDDGPATPVK